MKDYQTQARLLLEIAKQLQPKLSTSGNYVKIAHQGASYSVYKGGGRELGRQTIRSR